MLNFSNSKCISLNWKYIWMVLVHNLRFRVFFHLSLSLSGLCWLLCSWRFCRSEGKEGHIPVACLNENNREQLEPLFYSPPCSCALFHSLASFTLNQSFIFSLFSFPSITFLFYSPAVVHYSLLPSLSAYLISGLNLTSGRTTKMTSSLHNVPQLLSCLQMAFRGGWERNEQDEQL